MQEEIENKTVNLAITTTKLSARVMWKALNQYLAVLKEGTVKHSNTGVTSVKGKQSVKDLIGQNQGVSSMPIGETGLKEFHRIAKRYGVDFAIVKDKNVTPTKYTVFFKARDADSITQVLQEYSSKVLKKQEQKSSVLLKLKQYKELVANISTKALEKKKELMR